MLYKPISIMQHGGIFPETVIRRRQHRLDPNVFNPRALRIIQRLQNSGYQAYLVGGCVRDALLKRQPKDFDIATSATPEQIRKEFRNSRIVGRRFKLVHIFFEREIIEVATFRTSYPIKDKGDYGKNVSSKNGRILRDNFYGTLEEDVYRRDFTINALYYNPIKQTILDYTGGFPDLEKGIIRLIGNAKTRYIEDPVRILRAVRFSAKLNLGIENNTVRPIDSTSHTLREVPSPRLFEEILKIFLSGYSLDAFEILVDLRIFEILFQPTHQSLNRNPDYVYSLISRALERIDSKIRNKTLVEPERILSALLYPVLLERLSDLIKKDNVSFDTQQITKDLLSEQCKYTSIPRRFTLKLSKLWNSPEFLSALNRECTYIHRSKRHKRKKSWT